MARKFPGCVYGPMGLRPALRTRLMRGERIVGWGVARRGMSVLDTIGVVGVSLLPAVGTVAGAAMAARSVRVMVLTDRRLLLFAPDVKLSSRTDRGVTLDAPLHQLEVRGTRSRYEFRVRGPGWLHAEPYRLGRPKRVSQRMLVEGLRVLSSEEVAGDAGGRRGGRLGSSRGRDNPYTGA